jgi:hemoglobin
VIELEGMTMGLKEFVTNVVARYRKLAEPSPSSSPAPLVPVVDIDAAYLAGRKAGHAAEGYEDGRKAGYEVGQAEGYEEGYKKGYDEGFQRGIEAKAPVEALPSPERAPLPLSLYERLGGVYSIATVIDDFIDRVMIDPRLNANPRVDEAHHRVPPAGFKYLVYLVTEMLCWAAGGPQKYTGRAMKESHQHLMITAAEWEAFLDDLQQTLDKFAVPEAEQAEIKAIIGSTRADIVV